MFVSVNFPVADFRYLKKDQLGRLPVPKWGEADPQAKFMRGFGPIQTRTKPSEGFVAESYYADCDNLLRYPGQLFIYPLKNSDNRFLVYPVYRRFYFDGVFSGRFEFGLRINELTIEDIVRASEYYGCNIPEYDIYEITKQILQRPVEVHLLDGRILRGPFVASDNVLRDGYILSSTRKGYLEYYDLHNDISPYVHVGRPHVFIRSTNETPIAGFKRKRQLLEQENFDAWSYITGISYSGFDVTAIRSHHSITDEQPEERFVRIFYSQVRSLTFAHSVFVQQVDGSLLSGDSRLEEGVRTLISRLQDISTRDKRDKNDGRQDVINTILFQNDVDVEGLIKELNKRVRRGLLLRTIPGLAKYIDKKVDVGIEAAASAFVSKALTADR